MADKTETDKIGKFIVQCDMEENPDYTLNLVLFTEVENTYDLRQKIVQGKLEAALLNASMVLLFNSFMYTFDS